MSTHQVQLPADVESPRRARRFVAEALTEDRAAMSDVISLLVSEVVTNSILHARTEVNLSIACDGTHIRVEVADSSPLAPVIRNYSDLAGTGRGMVLVEELSDAWGLQTVDGGKVVWFEVETAEA